MNIGRSDFRKYAYLDIRKVKRLGGGGSRNFDPIRLDGMLLQHEQQQRPTPLVHCSLARLYSHEAVRLRRRRRVQALEFTVNFPRRCLLFISFPLLLLTRRSNESYSIYAHRSPSLFSLGLSSGGIYICNNISIRYINIASVSLLFSRVAR